MIVITFLKSQRKKFLERKLESLKKLYNDCSEILNSTTTFSNTPSSSCLCNTSSLGFLNPYFIKPYEFSHGYPNSMYFSALNFRIERQIRSIEEKLKKL